MRDKFTTGQAARALGLSRQWVQTLARRFGLGRVVTNAPQPYLLLSARDVQVLRETPRPTGRPSKRS